MAPIEIVSFYVNDTSEILEVSFRFESDQEDEIREDFIDLSEVSKFGYKFENKKNLMEDLFEENEEDFFEEEELEVSSNEIGSFLSEYYLIYPDKLPTPEMF